MLVVLSTAIGVIATTFVAARRIESVKNRLQKDMDILEEKESVYEKRAEKASIISELARVACVDNDHICNTELRILLSLRSIALRKKRIDAMYAKLLRKKPGIMTKSAIIGAAGGALISSIARLLLEDESLWWGSTA